MVTFVVVIFSVYFLSHYGVQHVSSLFASVGGEITGNNAEGMGGGVYNSVTNTATDGFWMTGGLIYDNTAGGYPAISGDVAFSNLAVVQINAEGTTVNVETAIAGMANYSYVKPIMPDSEKLGPMMELNAAIAEAGAYYESIEVSNPEAAAILSDAIIAAIAVRDNAYSTPTGIETATTTLREALSAAQADVALKRITIAIPAKSYIARIDADKRKIETAVDGVSLYSVKSVTNIEVELTAALGVVAAEMPYLIYNDNEEEKIISIVLSTEEATAVEYDSDHFFGTLTDKTFTAEDMAATDHYVLQNGQDFVWVKDAGTLAAGKCWIELAPSSAANARRLVIVHEGELTPTGINAVSSETNACGKWYDMSGRRVMQPTKGVFIMNGKKVVVK